jgi:Flp pilus assembly protein TadB
MAAVISYISDSAKNLSENIAESGRSVGRKFEEIKGKLSELSAGRIARRVSQVALLVIAVTATVALLIQALTAGSLLTVAGLFLVNVVVVDSCITLVGTLHPSKSSVDQQLKSLEDPSEKLLRFTEGTLLFSRAIRLGNWACS